MPEYSSEIQTQLAIIESREKVLRSSRLRGRLLELGYRAPQSIDSRSVGHHCSLPCQLFARLRHTQRKGVYMQTPRINVPDRYPEFPLHL
jgi:hypothetical protein